MASDPKYKDELEDGTLKRVYADLADLKKEIDTLGAEPPRWHVALAGVFLFVVVVGIAYLIHQLFPSLNGAIARISACLGFSLVVAGAVLVLKYSMKRFSRRIDRDERELLARIERTKRKTDDDAE